MPIVVLLLLLLLLLVNVVDANQHVSMINLHTATERAYYVRVVLLREQGGRVSVDFELIKGVPRLPLVMGNVAWALSERGKLHERAKRRVQAFPHLYEHSITVSMAKIRLGSIPDRSTEITSTIRKRQCNDRTSQSERAAGLELHTLATSSDAVRKDAAHFAGIDC